MTCGTQAFDPAPYSSPEGVKEDHDHEYLISRTIHPL